MAKRKPDYPPLILGRKWENEYARYLELADTLIQDQKEGKLKWDNMCHLPIGAAQAVLQQGMDRKSAVSLAPVLVAVSGWREHKKSFTFSPNMEALLIEHKKDLQIPVEVLYNLPDKCIYVELSGVTNKEFRKKYDMNLHGFYVYLEDDTHANRQELRFLLVYRSLETMPFQIHLGQDMLLSDGIDAMFEETKKNVGLVVEKERRDQFFDLFCILTQMVIYICSVDADIVKTEDSFADRYDVGGGLERETGYKLIATKRKPHVRAAHWHHYWTGSRSEPDRKLIVRWVPPTFVNIEKIEDDIEDKTIGDQKDEINHTIKPKDQQ